MIGENSENPLCVLNKKIYIEIIGENSEKNPLCVLNKIKIYRNNRRK